MMYNKISILEEQISNLRDELDDLIKQEEVKYDIVLDLSRKLDDLIVLYVTTKAKKHFFKVAIRKMQLETVENPNI